MALAAPKTVEDGLATYVFTATGDYNLGDADSATISSYVLQFVKDATTISVVIKKKVHGSVLVADSAAVSSAYYDASVGETEVAAATAITADKLIYLPCDGSDLVLAVNTLSGGNATVRVEVRRLKG